MLSAEAQTYVNPILGGDYPDPTIMREGKDYYMTHSAFDYQPGLTVWHSRDLVNWEPISYERQVLHLFHGGFQTAFQLCGVGQESVWSVERPHQPASAEHRPLPCGGRGRQPMVVYERR